MPYTSIWILLTIGCITLEALQPGLFIFLPCGLACGIAAITSWLLASLWIDILVLCTSLPIICILFRIWSRTIHTTASTNVYTRIGQTGYVLTPIYPDQKGYVRIDREDWLADGQNTYIPEYTRIRVIDIQGCHLIVQKDSL